MLVSASDRQTLKTCRQVPLLVNFQEKPTFRVWCLYRYLVHAPDPCWCRPRRWRCRSCPHTADDERRGWAGCCRRPRCSAAPGRRTGPGDDGGDCQEGRRLATGRRPGSDSGALPRGLAAETEGRPLKGWPPPRHRSPL